MTTSEHEYNPNIVWPTDPAQRDMLLAEQETRKGKDERDKRNN